MNKLMVKKAIFHAVIWILLYIVIVNIGDVLSEQTGIPNSVTSGLLIAFSVGLVLYLKKNNWVGKFGIRRITKNDLSKTVFYVPLILLAFIQFFAGIDTALSITEIATFCLLMIGVGFIEEMIFRGFLFHGILEKSGIIKAILISGITFGFGHIVNLLRGYDYEELVGQIIVAIAIGITLAMLVAITKNIVPGILFHIIFNISGSITPSGTNMEIYLMIAILCIAVFYGLYLSKSLSWKNGTADIKDMPKS